MIFCTVKQLDKSLVFLTELNFVPGKQNQPLTEHFKKSRVAQLVPCPRLSINRINLIKRTLITQSLRRDSDNTHCTTNLKSNPFCVRHEIVPVINQVSHFQLMFIAISI